MLKSILNLKGAQIITKESQSTINGGLTFSGACPTGCFSFFLCPNGTKDVCVVPGASGEICYGTHTNGQCCL